MKRKRNGLVPIGEVCSDLGGPVKEIREASPQALHHFTHFDQVNQLVGASEADPDLGFMARMMALCSLPRTNPGNRKEYVRRNGPYTLVMSAGGLNKLPFGNMPRLLLGTTTGEAFKDEAEAARWHRMAAEQGHADAQSYLGLMYAIGRGVFKDSVLAHMWLNIAGANGNEGARESRDALERVMTRAEISRATKLARTCMDSDYQDCAP